MFDVTVIGAGPAGCVAALQLARAGRRVCLVEQHRFPRDKVCGECLSALGYQTIERLGLGHSFHRLDPVRLTRSLIHPANAASIEIALPTPMWGVSRMRFDEWLLDQACEAGATIIQPARCEQIRPRIVVRDLVSNELRELQSEWTLLADGKRSLLDSKPAPTKDLGIKAHFTNITGLRDAIELFGVDGHYGGIAAIEDGKWNIAFSVPRRRVQFARGDLDSMFARIVSENSALKERFRAAIRCSEWLASPLPRFAVQRNWPAKVIPIGNAAAAIEPIGGEGMGLAMRSAELAAQMLLSGHVDLQELRRQYRRLWNPRSAGCRLVAKVVSNRVSARLVPRVARIKPARDGVMALMGKTTIASANIP
jgi:flavin-dependent dehydrogenase